jgi:hypothetical protein
MTKEVYPFDQARAIVRALELSTKADYERWSKSGARPAYIPGAPHVMYKNKGWQGWPDWLKEQTTSLPADAPTDDAPASSSGVSIVQEQTRARVQRFREKQKEKRKSVGESEIAVEEVPPDKRTRSDVTYFEVNGTSDRTMRRYTSDLVTIFEKFENHPQFQANLLDNLLRTEALREAKVSPSKHVVKP